VVEHARGSGGNPPLGTLLFQMPESMVEIRCNYRSDVVSRRTIPDFNSTFRDFLATLGLRLGGPKAPNHGLRLLLRFLGLHAGPEYAD
jgi:hypothetical protein